MINNIKVLILGDSYSGKTTLIHKIIGQPIKNINVTLGIDFFQKKNNNNLIQIYDAGGNRDLFNIISVYLKNIDLIILIYDLNSVHNNKSIRKWFDIIKNYSKPILLIGNKKELKNYTPKIPKEILDKHNIIGHEEISCFNENDYHIILEYIDNFFKNKFINTESEEECFRCC